MSNIFRNIGWLLGSRGINAAFSLVYLGLATRTLGIEGFGAFAMILVLAQAVAGIASFNTWQMLVKWGHFDGDAAPPTGFAMALDLASMAGGILLALAAGFTAPLWLPLPLGSGALIVALSAAALLALRSTPTGILRLHDRYDLSTAAEASLPLTRAAGAVAAAIWVPTLAGFVAAWALAELICAAAYWLLAARFVSVRLSDVSLARFPSRYPGIWPFVVATSLSRTLAVVSKQVLLLGVGAFGGAALAGGYRVASQLGQALVQLGEAVSRAIYPEFVRSADSSAAVTRRMVALAALTGALSVAAAVMGGRFAIEWIAGAAFAFAYPALVILSFAGAIELAASSWEALLVARQRAGRALAMRLGPLVLALSAMPWAIAAYGLIGVAACILAASVLTFAGLAHAVSATRGQSGAAIGSIA